MKIGILSDTRGNLSGLLDIVSYFQDDIGVDKIFHLGNFYADIDELISLKRSLLKGSTDYTDQDFLSDISHFMMQKVEEKRLDPASLLQEDEIGRLRRIIVRVPEAESPLLKAGGVQKMTIEMVGDRIAVLVHNIKTLRKEDIEGADIIFYGGTCRHQVDNLGGRWFINPGHFMEEDGTGRPPTFGLIDSTSGGVRLGFYSSDKTELLSRTLTFGPRTKMTVK